MPKQLWQQKLLIWREWTWREWTYLTHHNAVPKRTSQWFTSHSDSKNIESYRSCWLEASIEVVAQELVKSQLHTLSIIEPRSQFYSEYKVSLTKDLWFLYISLSHEMLILPNMTARPVRCMLRCGLDCGRLTCLGSSWHCVVEKRYVRHWLLPWGHCRSNGRASLTRSFTKRMELRLLRSNAFRVSRSKNSNNVTWLLSERRPLLVGFSLGTRRGAFMWSFKGPSRVRDQLLVWHCFRFLLLACCLLPFPTTRYYLYMHCLLFLILHCPSIILHRFTRGFLMSTHLFVPGPWALVFLNNSVQL